MFVRMYIGLFQGFELCQGAWCSVRGAVWVVPRVSSCARVHDVRWGGRFKLCQGSELRRGAWCSVRLGLELFQGVVLIVSGCGGVWVVSEVWVGSGADVRSTAKSKAFVGFEVHDIDISPNFIAIGVHELDPNYDFWSEEKRRRPYNASSWLAMGRRRCCLDCKYPKPTARRVSEFIHMYM
jgi:hypothetical protein